MKVLQFLKSLFSFEVIYGNVSVKHLQCLCYPYAAASSLIILDNSDYGGRHIPGFPQSDDIALPRFSLAITTG